MKKSLIKSLLPVLIVVLALSMISITVVADNYTGYVYDPENPCETIDQIKYDGLNRVKTALPDEEKPGKYDGLDEEKYALEDEEKPGKYDGLDEEKYALEDEEKPGKYDGLNEEVRAGARCCVCQVRRSRHLRSAPGSLRHREVRRPERGQDRSGGFRGQRQV